jgi:hypothetical protein
MVSNDDNFDDYDHTSFSSAVAFARSLDRLDEYFGPDDRVPSNLKMPMAGAELIVKCCTFAALPRLPLDTRMKHVRLLGSYVHRVARDIPLEDMKALCSCNLFRLSVSLVREALKRRGASDRPAVELDQEDSMLSIEFIVLLWSDLLRGGDKWPPIRADFLTSGAIAEIAIWSTTLPVTGRQIGELYSAT